MAQQTDAGPIEAETVDVPRTTVAGVLDLVHSEIDNQQAHAHAHGEGPYVEELLEYARHLQDALDEE